MMPTPTCHAPPNTSNRSYTLYKKHIADFDHFKLLDTVVAAATMPTGLATILTNFEKSTEGCREA
jgi:hypothetical protein